MASLLQTVSAYATIARKVYWQNKAATKALCQEFKIDTKLNNRIAFYTAQSAITNHWFCTLRGKAPIRREQRDGLLIGAITPLLDDAVDEQHIESTDLLEALKQGENSGFALPAQLYRSISQHQSTLFSEAFETALKAQDASLKQLHNTELSDEELIRITAEKGGSWTFLYRAVLDHPVLEGEKEAIYTLGFLMQLTNDAFDVYKDLQNGQQTLFTNAVEIEPLRVLYQEQLDKIKSQFLTLAYNSSHKQECLLAISAIGARGIVCIDQLLRCQQLSGGAFLPRTYARQQLICDMEKPANIWKSLQWSKHMF